MGKWSFAEHLLVARQWEPHQNRALPDRGGTCPWAEGSRELCVRGMCEADVDGVVCAATTFSQDRQGTKVTRSKFWA